MDDSRRRQVEFFKFCEILLQHFTAALAHPGIVGVFRCQLIGTHGNDRWFKGKAKRNYLKDDGTPFERMAAEISKAIQAALKAVYTLTP